MKKRITKILPVILAALLQLAPTLRTFFVQAQAWAPCGWAVVLKVTTGAVALFGFHAISSASSIALSPPNATNGVPYTGTITYSGGHAASVSSMALSNQITGTTPICIGSSQPLGGGLSIIYSGGNKATVSGTPTAASNLFFRVLAYDTSGCGSGENDKKQTATLVIGAGGGGGVAPVIVGAPTSTSAQLGSDALLSVTASGNPAPRYYWYLGPPIANVLVSTNSSLLITNVQYTNSGLYTVLASNASGITPNTAGQAYLSVCQTPGSNILTLHYTNYVVVSNAVSMNSWFTNVSTGSNVYQWLFNLAPITSYSTSGSNFSLVANQVFAGRSGTYSVLFNSVVGPTTALDNQQYDSYWAFGTPPGITTQPPATTNLFAGSNITLTVTAFLSRTPYTNDTISYQWYFNGINPLSSGVVTGSVDVRLEGSGGSLKAYSNYNALVTQTLNNISNGNAGNYTVVLSNFWGSITSAATSLTVTQSSAPPLITAEPSPRSVLVGQNTSFSVTATGAAPLNYQWQKIGLGNLSDGGVYSGVNTNVLTLTGVGLGNAGNYLVVITNAAGSTNSTTVALSVSSPPTLSIDPAGPGNAQLTATMPTGMIYIVELALSLTPPVSWSPVTTNVVPPSGVILYSNPTTNGAQFFRLTFP